MHNKALFKRILFTIVVLAVFLIILELAFRVAYPLYSNYNTEMWRYAKEIKQLNPDQRIAHEHRPNSKAELYGTTITINSNGWRDREYPLEKSKYRIMALGDSITLGWGVDLEDSLSKLLEKKLNNQSDWAEVINTGVGNYNTEMEVYSFLDKGRKYNPDMIILVYYINDAEITHAIPSKAKSSLLKSSYLYGFISDKVINIKVKLDPEYQFNKFYSNLYEPDFEGRIRAESAISVLADYCRKNNIALNIIVIPEMHDFENYSFQQVTDFVRSAGEKNNVRVFDLLSYFKGHKPESLWVSLEDPHPNAEGQEIIAEAAYQEIFKHSDFINQQGL